MYFLILRLNFLSVMIANTAFIVINKISVDTIQYGSGSKTLTFTVLHRKSESK